MFSPLSFKEKKRIRQQLSAGEQKRKEHNKNHKAQLQLLPVPSELVTCLVVF
jgi:hypothetical protein